MKKYLLIIFCLFCSIVFSSCDDEIYSQGIDFNDKIDLPTSISEISYDYNKSWGYRAYIEEDGDYVPFIVLSSDYNGYCLLLREYLLDELIEYNVPGEYGSYYSDSKVDTYLNETYYWVISEDLRNKIIDSQIEITTRNAIDTHNDETEIISRKIFLLSANEVNASLSNILLKEGAPLSYFKEIENRTALHENGEADSWMLRTPALSGGNNLIGVGYDGSVGMGSISGIDGINESSVRPAFCVPLETKIELSSDIVEGKDVFFIK